MKNALLAPLSVIETWPKPNYDNPPTRGPALFALCIVFPIIATVLVGLRTYSRIFIVRSFGIDDILTCISLGFAIALSSLIAYADRVFCMGRHVWDIPPDTAIYLSRNNWYSEICYMMATATIKISVLLFYRRLTVRCSRLYLFFVHAGIVYNVLYGLIFLIVLLTSCSPLPAYWMRMDPIWRFKNLNDFHCVRDTILLPMSGVFSVIGDIYATSLPFIAILPMRLTRRQRISLNAIFATATTVVLAGFARTGLILYLVLGSYDFTWSALTEVWAISQLEIYLSIYCACAPALKPLFGRFFGSTFRSTDHGPATLSRAASAPPYASIKDRKKSREHSRVSTDDGVSKYGEIIVHTEVSIFNEEIPDHDKMQDDLESSAGRRGRAKSQDEVPLRPVPVPKRHISACWNGHQPPPSPGLQALPHRY